MDNDSEYASLLRQLGQMNSEEILRVIVEAKTGRKDYCDQIPVEVDATAAGALAAFIAALEKHNANRLIDASLK